MVSIIDLSDKIPNARIKIKSGTGFLTFGISTTILPIVYLSFSCKICIFNVLSGFDAFSDTVLIIQL